MIAMDSSSTFKPQLRATSALGIIYRDGAVFGAVDIEEMEDGGRRLSIHDWSSVDPGNGHTTRALQWLRQQGFSYICAHSVGSIRDLHGDRVADDSARYWAHMARKGLVDAFFDDEGVELQATTDGVVRRQGRRPNA